jgi:hypothetical protein
VTLVEWADRAVALLPEERLDLAIEFAGPTERVLRAVARGEEFAGVLRSLEGAGFGGRSDRDPDD